ncbi:MAG: YbbR-like domain-containing protein [Bacteriovoracia bacterium]
MKFEKTVALEYIMPPDMIFAEKPVQEVTFLIEGPRAFVRTVAEREDRLVIDLNRANARRQLNFTMDINPAQLNLPFGMVVERVLPRRINIKLEKKASKIVPLRLQFAGHLPEKLSLQNPTLVPSEVEVYGPRSIITRLKELPVRPIDLENLPGQDQVSVEIHLPDERLSLSGSNEAKLNYQLKAASSNLTLKSLPIRFLSDRRKINSKVKAADVKLLVPEKIIKNRSNVSSTVQIWADIPANARGRTEVPLKVILPPSIHLLEVIPKTIIVNVQ